MEDYQQHDGHEYTDPNNSFVVQHSSGPLCLNIKIDMSALLRLTCTDFVLKISLYTINSIGLLHLPARQIILNSWILSFNYMHEKIQNKKLNLKELTIYYALNSLKYIKQYAYRYFKILILKQFS